MLNRRFLTCGYDAVGQDARMKRSRSGAVGAPGGLIVLLGKREDLESRTCSYKVDAHRASVWKTGCGGEGNFASAGLL